MDLLVRSLLLSGVATIALTFGCGDSTPSGGDADAGGPIELPMLVTGDSSDPSDPVLPRMPEAPNMACLGMRSAPTGGDDITFSVQITEFRTDETLEGLCVRYYANNMPVPGETCESSDPVTDAEGRISVTGPSDAWFAYRVFPKDGPTAARQIAGSVQINEPAPATEGGTEEGNSVSQATLNLIPTVLGFRQEAGTAIVAGTALDCDEDPLYGGLVRIYRDDGTEVVEGSRSSDPHFRYFDGDEFPSNTMQWTHTDGLFASANIPVASDGEFVFVELWARREEGGERELIGCDRIAIFENTISLVNMDPLRADAPACPGAS